MKISDELEGDDFDLKIEKDADGTRVEVPLPASAEHSYELFSDATHISEWLVVVGTVVVRQRDAKGRALEVDFMGSLERASIAYTLTYEYDDAALEVRWNYKGGSLRKLAGSARFLPGDQESCVLVYKLASELPKGLPPWADELYRARPAETVVLDFCEWLEVNKDKLPDRRRK